MNNSSTLKNISNNICLKRFKVALLFGVFLILSINVNAIIADLWTRTGIENEGVGAYAISPNFAVDQTIFALATNGVYKSTDGGNTWQLSNNDLPWDSSNFYPLFASSAISPQFASDSTLFVNSPGFGIYKSNNSGANWTAVNTETDLLWAEVAVSPNYAVDKTVFIGTSPYLLLSPKVAKSTDRGTTWQNLSIPLNAPENAFSVFEIAFSPNYANDQIIFFVGAEQVGFATGSWIETGAIFRSNDSGATWNLTTVEINAHTIDFSPNFAMDKTIIVGTENTDGVNHIIKSTDGGNTWHPSGSGIEPTDVRDIKFSQNYSFDNVVYASVGGEGVFISMDNGSSWQPLWNGLTLGEQLCGVNPTIVLSPNYLADHKIFLGTESISQCLGVWQYSITGPVAFVPEGTNVSVTNLGNSASINFSSVQSSGKLIIYVTPEAPVPPVGFALFRTPENGSYYNINTTAVYSGNIVVTLPYDPTAVGDPKMYHYNNATEQWEDVTTSVDSVANTITGVVNSLSPFALGTPLQDTTVNFTGFLSPIKTDGKSVFKFGNAVPVKFRLTDSNGDFITNHFARLFVAKVVNNVAGDEQEAVAKGHSNILNIFRYDGYDNTYIFNLDTKKLSKGKWQLRVELQNGESHTVMINLF